MEQIILEAKSGKTKYKCEFCNYRGTKAELVDHVEEKHPEMIPKEYTAARMVFNYINKKDHGTCIVCGKETEWREDLWRYDRIHPKCNESYTRYMRSNMKKVYGKENLLNDPEQQEKMLKNRSISGTYKFSDGGTKEYVGSYEKKTLEFLDKVLHVQSSDLQCPGPVIEYRHNKQTHFWITDIYYIPLNLVIEVKDGGDNPNTRQMEEYREKQLEKEEAIKKGNTYNYLRLTNNNFEQLMFMIADLKSNLLDDKDTKVIHVNETGGNTAVGMAMAPSGANDFAVLMPYRNPENNLMSIAFKNNNEEDIYIIDDETNEIKKESMEYVRRGSYAMYKYKKNLDMELFGKYTDKKYSEKVIPRQKDFFYNILTGRNLLTDDQLDYDEDFEKIEIGRIFY